MILPAMLKHSACRTDTPSGIFVGGAGGDKLGPFRWLRALKSRYEVRHAATAKG